MELVFVGIESVESGRLAFHRRVLPSLAQRVGPFPLMQIASMEICAPCPTVPVFASLPVVPELPVPAEERQTAKALCKASIHSPAAWSV